MSADAFVCLCSVRTVLLSIQSLLGEPNNDSPLNPYAAKVRCHIFCCFSPALHYHK